MPGQEGGRAGLASLTELNSASVIMADGDASQCPLSPPSVLTCGLNSWDSSAFVCLFLLFF